MGVCDVIFDSIGDMLDEIVRYYEPEQYLEIADDDDILKIIAVKLKVVAKSNYLKSDTEALERLNTVNWTKRARKFIVDYLMEHYLLEPEVSDDDRVNPFICTIGVVKK